MEPRRRESRARLHRLRCQLEATMAGAFVRKLLHGADLDEADCRALADAVSMTQLIAARTDLIEEGDRPSLVHVVLDGFACRYKTLEDGGRQILAWLVPGD